MASFTVVLEPRVDWRRTVVRAGVVACLVAFTLQGQETQPTSRSPVATGIARCRELMRLAHRSGTDPSTDSCWIGIRDTSEALMKVTDNAEVLRYFALSAIYFESVEHLEHAHRAIFEHALKNQTSPALEGAFRALEAQLRARRRPLGSTSRPTSVYDWATVIRNDPDPAIVPVAWQRAIASTGRPWCVRDNATGIEMLLIPPGTYLRGAPDDDPEGTPAERPAYTAIVEKPFYLGKCEVTNKEYTLFDPTHLTLTRTQNPGANVANAPVACLDARRIDLYCKGYGLRLPTHVEWEWAARGGTKESRYGELSKIAWSFKDHLRTDPASVRRRREQGQLLWNGTRPVGTKLPNAFGLHDMLGNVAELVSDIVFTKDYRGLPTPQFDPYSYFPFPESYRVYCGGCWDSTPDRCRASHRRFLCDWMGGASHGFRVARTAN